MQGGAVGKELGNREEDVCGLARMMCCLRNRTLSGHRYACNTLCYRRYF